MQLTEPRYTALPAKDHEKTARYHNGDTFQLPTVKPRIRLRERCTANRPPVREARRYCQTYAIRSKNYYVLATTIGGILPKAVDHVPEGVARNLRVARFRRWRYMSCMSAAESMMFNCLGESRRDGRTRSNQTLCPNLSDSYFPRGRDIYGQSPLRRGN